MVKLEIQRRSRRGEVQKLGTIDIDASATLVDLQKKFSSEIRKTELSRQRFVIPPAKEGERGKPLEYGKPLSSYGLKDGAVLEFKDLGKQIGWRTVFLIEYFGPLVLYPIFYLRPALIYGADACAAPYQLAQKLALALWTFHYLKRELETVFVHHWGPNATMPVFNVVKNSLYYWGAAVAVAYFVNHPLYTSPPVWAVWVGAVGFLVSALLNGVVHLQLAALREPGTRSRKIPRGILFALVSCPNYTFEVLTWVFFNLATSTLAGIVFLVLGTAQMTVWALGKHRRYRDEFGKDYPRGRRAIFPFIL